MLPLGRVTSETEYIRPRVVTIICQSSARYQYLNLQNYVSRKSIVTAEIITWCFMQHGRALARSIFWPHGGADGINCDKECRAKVGFIHVDFLDVKLRNSDVCL